MSSYPRNVLIQSLLLNDNKRIREFLAEGANINEVDSDGRTSLIHAVINDNIEIVRLLISSGVDMNAQDYLGYTALHYAAQNFLPEIALLLIGSGVAVDIADNHGNTPLARASFASDGRGDLIRILLKAGADKNSPNKYGQTPLTLAKLIANYDVVQFFD